MNKSERVGFNWLLTQGYSEDDINFSHRRTPDFITSDNKGWEVKRIYGTTIWLYPNQLEKIKEAQATTLVIRDGEEIPLAKIPPENLEPETVYKGVRIITPKSPEGRRKFTFYLPETTYNKLQDYIAVNYTSSYGATSETINDALNNYLWSPESVKPPAMERYKLLEEKFKEVKKEDV